MSACWIVTAGFDGTTDIESLLRIEEILGAKTENDTIIAADGGANLLHRLRIIPDMLVGDMDSIEPEILDELRNRCEVEIFPSAKDETDAEIALRKAYECNPECIVIVNSMQNRVDQTLSLLSLLYDAKEKNIDARIETGKQRILLAQPRFCLTDHVGHTLSLLPVSEEVTKVETRGMEYPLCGETLYRKKCRGISNVVVDSPAEICYEKGDLLIIISLDGEDR